MAHVRANGTEISATKWIAFAIPLSTCVVGALLGTVVTIATVPSAKDLEKVILDAKETIAYADAMSSARWDAVERLSQERWTFHNDRHMKDERWRERVEDKLDRQRALLDELIKNSKP